MKEFLSRYSEALVAVLIALTTEVANRMFFESSQVGTALALQTAFVGLLLTVQRLSLEEARRHENLRIDRVADYLDLENTTSYANLRALNHRYGSITEEEFRDVKDHVIAEAQEELRRLAIDKRSATLQTTHYYDWLFRQFDRAGEGDYVHAVSLSSDEEWNDSQLEANFLKVNINAAQRGADIHRIFIVADDRLASFVENPPIKAHRPGSGKGLKGSVVSQEELTKHDAKTLKSVGQGFIDFNGQVGLEDIFDADGEVRGQVTMLPEDLQRMQSIYSRLLNMAKDLPDSPPHSSSDASVVPTSAQSTITSGG